VFSAVGQSGPGAPVPSISGPVTYRPARGRCIATNRATGCPRLVIRIPFSGRSFSRVKNRLRTSVTFISILKAYIGMDIIFSGKCSMRSALKCSPGCRIGHQSARGALLTSSGNARIYSSSTQAPRGEEARSFRVSLPGSPRSLLEPAQGVRMFVQDHAYNWESGPIPWDVA